MFYRFVLIAVAIFVTACSDPKAVSENNFKVAIQKDIDTVYPKCYLLENFPATVSDFDRGNKATFKALVNAGLLLEKEESRMTTEYLRNKEVVQPVFYLTEEGKKFYKADAGTKPMEGKAGGFCFGKATVKDITQFTEPSDASGMRISQVSYTYVVGDFPAWAKLPEVLSAIRALKTDVESEKTPVEGFAVLSLTNNGWVNVMPRHN